MIRYTVKDDGERIVGKTAEEVLQRIIQKNPDTEIGTMTTAKYADELINNAYYFLTEDKAESILQTNDATFDKALRVLDAAPTSGTTIMTHANVELEGARS